MKCVIVFLFIILSSHPSIAQDYLLVPDSLFDEYVTHYEKVKAIRYEKDSKRKILNILEENSNKVSQIEELLFGSGFTGKNRENLLKAYSNSLEYLSSLQKKHPEATFELIRALQTRWNLRYGFYDLRPWIRDGEQIGMASMILTGLFALSATQKMQPSKLKSALRLTSHFLPAIGIMGGRKIGKLKHKNKILDLAPPAPSHYIEIDIDQKPVYDAYEVESKKLLATAIAWGGSVTALSATRKTIQLLSKGKILLKSGKWSLFGYIVSSIMTGFIDRGVFQILQDFNERGLQIEYYDAIKAYQKTEKNNRFKKLIAADRLIEATYQLFYFKIYPFQKNIKNHLEYVQNLETDFLEDTKEIKPASGIYQQKLRKKDQLVYRHQVSLAQSILTRLEQNEYTFDRPFVRAKLRWLLANNRISEINKYGVEAINIVNTWVTQAEKKGVLDLPSYLKKEQRTQNELQAEKLYLDALGGRYQISPSQMMFKSICLLEISDEPILRGRINKMLNLLHEYESQIEAYLLDSAQPIPLASEFTVTRAERAFDRFIERHNEDLVETKNQKNELNVRKYFNQKMTKEAEAFSKIISHFTPTEFNRFYLNFLSRKFITEKKNWSAIQALTTALMDNRLFREKQIQQAEYANQDPSLAYADRIVTSWIMISFLRGGGSAIGFWKTLKNLKNKIKFWFQKNPTRSANALSTYARLYKKTYRSVPTRFGKKIFRRITPGIENFTLSVPTGMAWVWTEKALHTEYIDPAETLASWEMAVLTGIYEKWYLALQSLEKLVPKDIKTRAKLIETLIASIRETIKEDYETAIHLQSINPEHRAFFEIGIRGMKGQLKFQLTRWALKLEKQKKSAGDQNQSPDAPQKKLK